MTAADLLALTAETIERDGIHRDCLLPHLFDDLASPFCAPSFAAEDHLRSSLGFCDLHELEEWWRTVSAEVAVTVMRHAAGLGVQS